MDDLIQIFEKYLNKAKYEEHKVSTEECKKCGGQCCKALGCQFSPSDFKKIDYDTLLNFINDTKCISIDWWEGNPFEEDDNIENSYFDIDTGNLIDSNNEQVYKSYFLRIRNVDSPIVDPSYGGRCCLLTDTGCKLPFELRAKGARELYIPKGIDECIPFYNKRDCAKEWFKYRDILHKLAIHFSQDSRSTLESFTNYTFSNFIQEFLNIGDDTNE